jgi:hypothetical protein
MVEIWEAQCIDDAAFSLKELLLDALANLRRVIC